MMLPKVQLDKRILNHKVCHICKEKGKKKIPDEEYMWEIIKRVEVHEDYFTIIGECGCFRMDIKEEDTEKFLNGEDIIYRKGKFTHQISLGGEWEGEEGDYWGLTGKWKDRWWQAYLYYLRVAPSVKEALNLTDKAIRTAWAYIEGEYDEDNVIDWKDK